MSHMRSSVENISRVPELKIILTDRIAAAKLTANSWNEVKILRKTLVAFVAANAGKTLALSRSLVASRRSRAVTVAFTSCAAFYVSLFSHKRAWIAVETVHALLAVVAFSVVDALETFSSERVAVARFQLVDISVALAVLANSMRAEHSKWIAEEVFLAALAAGTLRSGRTSVAHNSESVCNSLWHC